MKLFISLIVGTVVGYSSAALSCMPRISMDVTHNIHLAGVRDLDAHDVGGPDHAKVFIKMNLSKDSTVTFDKEKLELLSNQKNQNSRVVTFRVIGSGTHDIVVLQKDREIARQKVTTKILPTTRGC